MKVAVIGGGIGGLTTALALKRAGIPFILYEATPEVKHVGAGIIMANNALQVFRHLGIHEQIYSKGNQIDKMIMARADFRPISAISLSGFETRYGLQNHAIHRADLHTVIAGAVGEEHIELGKRLQHIEKTGIGYKLSFEDGTVVQHQFVIGADGIRSQVRQQLFAENEYRDMKQVCWRGVTDYDLPQQYRHEAIEAWHKGRRAGIVQISKGKVYWYLVINADQEVNGPALDAYTLGFHPLIGDLVQATPADTIIKARLYDLKPVHQWYKDNVCLIGDAAHATSPNLGQGACQAVEDAYVLGELARKYSLAEAFEKYPEIRRAKAHYIVKTSRQLGMVSHLSHPVATGLRNFVFKYLTPQSVNLKQMDKLFRLPEIK